MKNSGVNPAVRTSCAASAWEREAVGDRANFAEPAGFLRVKEPPQNDDEA